MTNLNVPGLGTFDDVGLYMRSVGEAARAAARMLARAGTDRKNAALDAIAAAIRRDEARLLAANADDVAAARAAGHDEAFVDRLTLTPKTIGAMADDNRFRRMGLLQRRKNLRISHEWHAGESCKLSDDSSRVMRTHWSDRRCTSFQSRHASY